MEFFKKKIKTFCAFCRSPRMVYKKKSVSFLDLVGSFFSALIFMYLLWQEFDARFLIIWIINIALAESFIRLRWRMSMPCPHCAFDPIIYRKDSAQAATLVKARLALRKENPRYMLSQPLNLPKITADRLKHIEDQQNRALQINEARKEQKAQTGRILSRSL